MNEATIQTQLLGQYIRLIWINFCRFFSSLSQNVFRVVFFLLDFSVFFTIYFSGRLTLLNRFMAIVDSTPLGVLFHLEFICFLNYSGKINYQRGIFLSRRRCVCGVRFNVLFRGFPLTLN